LFLQLQRYLLPPPSIEDNFLYLKKNHSSIWLLAR